VTSEGIQQRNLEARKTETKNMGKDMKIQIFDGKRYNVWMKRILMYLKWRKCDEAAIREKLPTESETAWQEKNLKAINYIYGSISDDQIEFVDEEKTAYDVMKKLDSMYLEESTAIQISVRNKLERLRLNDYEESSTFFIEFEKSINELKNAGAIVSQREKVNYMLRTLSDSLNYVGDLIDSLKEADRTCEFLKNKIIMWEARNKEKNCLTYTNKNALKSERKEPEKI